MARTIAIQKASAERAKKDTQKEKPSRDARGRSNRNKIRSSPSHLQFVLSGCRTTDQDTRKLKPIISRWGPGAFETRSARNATVCCLVTHTNRALATAASITGRIRTPVSARSAYRKPPTAFWAKARLSMCEAGARRPTYMIICFLFSTC